MTESIPVLPEELLTRFLPDPKMLVHDRNTCFGRRFGERFGSVSVRYSTEGSVVRPKHFWVKMCLILTIFELFEGFFSS